MSGKRRIDWRRGKIREDQSILFSLEKGRPQMRNCQLLDRKTIDCDREPVTSTGGGRLLFMVCSLRLEKN
ncbi:hypothetical protein Nepgr_007718 [Nepenthes gracilis]|uniref:Uncharacterized protein n=1 Tax=Nepenthes gracilis TaxID=150966 RepID=A0AAD3XIJ9_NEPGR|nr:hypothetical protein Nepgr_007718 [Nepenthes gracilis]